MDGSAVECDKSSATDLVDHHRVRSRLASCSWRRRCTVMRCWVPELPDQCWAQLIDRLSDEIW